MNNKPAPSRRNILTASAGLAAAAALTRAPMTTLAQDVSSPTLKGNINHSACQWCYKWPMEEFCANAQRLGLKGIDLVGPDWFPTLKKYGLVSTMTNSKAVPIDPGLNRKENHARFVPEIKKMIEATADGGFSSCICFSGNRKGMDDHEGMKNCAEGLKQVMSLAEEKKVTVHMELLNSKRNHKDYMCDRTAWGVELCKMVGSERFKLLYDIYHMQIDEGDVIATIRENHQYIGHYHTGGVPGRNEIDETQELFYPAIMKAIVDTGYKGIVAQEFIPKRDPLKSLEQAIRICDV